MLTKQLIRRLEAKLYDYAESRELPGPSLSVFEQPMPERVSPVGMPERWVLRHQQQFTDAPIIERALKALSPDHRKLVELRYFQGLPWPKVALELHVGRTKAYALRDEVLIALAYAFGFLGNGDGEKQAS